MPITNINEYPRTNFDQFSITGANLSADSRSKTISKTIPTVATAAGTTEVIMIVPFDAIITSIRYVFKEALAASDTNWIQFKVVNKGQAGAGTADVLSTAAVNSTKVTGGSALAAYVPRTPTLATAGGVSVTKLDALAVQVVATGTLANTLTQGSVQINYLVAT